RVVARLIAVPDVDRGARHRGAAAVRVLDRQLDRQRHALRHRRRRAEAGPDVLADDPALGEDIRAVRAITGERAGGLLWDDGAVGGRGRGRRGTSPFPLDGAALEANG